jgi:hypothetical protein
MCPPTSSVGVSLCTLDEWDWLNQTGSERPDNRGKWGML